MKISRYLFVFASSFLMFMIINAAPAKKTTTPAKPKATTTTVVKTTTSAAPAKPEPAAVTPKKTASTSLTGIKATTSTTTTSTQTALANEQAQFKLLLLPALALDIINADDAALVNAASVLSQAVTKEYLSNIGVKQTDAANKLVAVQQEQAIRVNLKAQLPQALSLDATKVDDNTLNTLITLLSQAAGRNYLGAQKNEAANKLVVAQNEQQTRKIVADQINQALTLDVVSVDDGTLTNLVAILTRAAGMDSLGTKKNDAITKLTLAQQEQINRKNFGDQLAQVLLVDVAAVDDNTLTTVENVLTQAASKVYLETKKDEAATKLVLVQQEQARRKKAVVQQVVTPVILSATQTKASLDKAVKGACYIKIDRNHVTLGQNGLDFTVDASKGHPFMLVPIIDVAPKAGTATYVLVPMNVQNALCVANENGRLALHNYVIGSPIASSEGWTQFTNMRYPDDKLRNGGITFSFKVVATP